MIFDHINNLDTLLHIESEDDYPHLGEILKPAADRVIRDAVGDVWITANEEDPTVKQLACILVATWFARPEAFGELTPGANFLITQLQARKLGGEPNA